MNDKKVAKTFYIFGNPDLEFDNLPIRLKPALDKLFPDITFVIQDPNENLKPDQNGELRIIDTVMGAQQVTLLNDLDAFADEPKYSMHDFDLGFQLKLLKKIGTLQKVTIVGVPPALLEDDAIQQCAAIIKRIV